MRMCTYFCIVRHTDIIIKVANSTDITIIGIQYSKRLELLINITRPDLNSKGMH